MTTAVLVTTNETRKGLMLMWSYKFNTLTEMFMFGFIFVGISYFMGNGTLDPDALAATLLGFMTWLYAIMAVSSMSWNLMEEAQAGTLEQMYMSPTHPWLIFVGRVFSTLASSTATVGATGLALVLILGIRISLDWRVFPVFAITMVGVFGLGFAIGGMTLVFKRVQALTNMVTNLLLFLNGSLLSVDHLPGWLETVARALPTTQGIIVMRQVALDGRSLGSVWASGDLESLVAHSAVLLLIGWVVFLLCERLAKKRGTLGQY